VIPAANVRHLMLRLDVVTAAAEGRFAIYPIDTVDQGIALLTGIPAGQRDAAGVYPPDTINRRVADCLDAFGAKAAELFRQAAAAETGAKGRRSGGLSSRLRHLGDARRHRRRGARAYYTADFKPPTF